MRDQCRRKSNAFALSITLPKTLIRMHTGWWLVSNSVGSNGWVPGAYLEKPDGKKEDLVTESAERGKGKLHRSLLTVALLL